MTRRIAIEPTLSHLKDALQARGYQVTPMQAGQRALADCYVVSGMSENLLGIHDTDGNRAPVINASGMTAEEVVREVERRSAEMGTEWGAPLV